MRIAIFSDSYNPSLDGVVTQINNMVREFTSAGHEVLVVAPAHSARMEEHTKGRLREILLPSIALPTYRDYRITTVMSPRVWKELKEFKPEVMHIQTPFSVGWLGLRYGKKLGIPVIGTYHTLLPEFLMYIPIPKLKDMGFAKYLTWKYSALFYNGCDVVTTPTQRMRGELERNGIKGAKVLSNAIDFGSFNSAKTNKRPSKALKLIYFGRIGYEKNIEVILFAMRHMLKKKMKVSLTVTGDGPALQYLKKIAKNEGIEASVEFTGKIVGEKLCKEVAKHDALVTASTIETQGLTILEAMAAGVPCIGANFLAIPDSVKEGENGYLFRPFDFGDLSKKAELLAGSASLRKKLRSNAIRTARKYTARRIAKETLAIYGAAIKERNASKAPKK